MGTTYNHCLETNFVADMKLRRNCCVRFIFPRPSLLCSKTGQTTKKYTHFILILDKYLSIVKFIVQDVWLMGQHISPNSTTTSQAMIHHISPTKSHHISPKQPPQLPQRATTSPPNSHHNSSNEPPHPPQRSTTSPPNSHHNSGNEPPHPTQRATTSPPNSHHISGNEPPHPPQRATTSPTKSHDISQKQPPTQAMSQQISSNDL